MKKPKPRHLKKEIAKQVRAIQIKMDLTPRQMRAMTALNELRKRQRLQQLADTTMHLAPANLYLSAFPVSQARLEMFEKHQEQTDRPLGLTDPGRAKDRDFSKLAFKATPEHLAAHDELGKDLKLIFKDGVAVSGTGWSVDHDGDIEHIRPKEDK